MFGRKELELNWIELSWENEIIWYKKKKYEEAKRNKKNVKSLGIGDLTRITISSQSFTNSD